MYEFKIYYANGKTGRLRKADKNKILDVCQNELKRYISNSEMKELNNEGLLEKINSQGDRIVIKLL